MGTPDNPYVTQPEVQPLAHAHSSELQGPLLRAAAVALVPLSVADGHPEGSCQELLGVLSARFAMAALISAVSCFVRVCAAKKHATRPGCGIPMHTCAMSVPHALCIQPTNSIASCMAQHASTCTMLLHCSGDCRRAPRPHTWGGRDTHARAASTLLTKLGLAMGPSVIRVAHQLGPSRDNPAAWMQGGHFAGPYMRNRVRRAVQDYLTSLAMTYHTFFPPASGWLRDQAAAGTTEPGAVVAACKAAFCEMREIQPFMPPDGSLVSATFMLLARVRWQLPVARALQAALRAAAAHMSPCALDDAGAWGEALLYLLIMQPWQLPFNLAGCQAACSGRAVWRRSTPADSLLSALAGLQLGQPPPLQAHCPITSPGHTNSSAASCTTLTSRAQTANQQTTPTAHQVALQALPQPTTAQSQVQPKQTPHQQHPCPPASHHV